MSGIYARVKENALRFPDKRAIVDDSGNHLTYSQLVVRVEETVRKLAGIINPLRSRVALCLDEGLEVPVAVLALNAMRVPVIPMNPGLQPDQIKHLLRSVDADVAVLERKTARLFEGCEPSIDLVVLDDPDMHESSGASAGKMQDDAGKLCVCEYDQFLITLSSGSTGSPKPIIFSEANKLARFEQATRQYSVRDNDVILCASPFYHSLGQRLTFLPLLAGATLVYLSRFTAQRWCESVIRNSVTFTIPVSSHLHELVDTLLETPFRFTSLRCLVTSSAAINDEIKKELFNSLPCDFHEMYGASEVATATDLNRVQAKLKSGSVGLPCPDVVIRVVDECLTPCQPGEVGQIIVRSPLASAGYYKLPEITKESFINGYFLTGDLGYLDEEGYLYFVDRKKDVIISGGTNIYPSDIEGVINEIPKVKICTVVGIRDPFLGEVPVAVVITHEDTRLLEREIRVIVHRRLAAFQRPFKYFFRESLPLTASGKVDKLALRDELNGLKLDLSSKLRALQNSQTRN